MRIKKTLGGESALMSLEKLYYLSVHTFNSVEGVKFSEEQSFQGTARTRAWLSMRMTRL